MLFSKSLGYSLRLLLLFLIPFGSHLLTEAQTPGNFSAVKGAANSWCQVKVNLGGLNDFKTADSPGWRNNGTTFSGTASGAVPVTVEYVCLGGISYGNYAARLSVKSSAGTQLLLETFEISKDGGSRSFSASWIPGTAGEELEVSASVTGGNPESFTYYVSGRIASMGATNGTSPLPTPKKTPSDPVVKVTRYGEDGVHHPLGFSISVKQDGKPVANAPVTFDVTGGNKGLKDTFMVADGAGGWSPVTRDKIFGVTADNALRTGADGTVSLYFLADFERIRMLNVGFPFYITLTASYLPDGKTEPVTDKANLVVKHSSFIRAVSYQNGDVLYPESRNPLATPGSRVKTPVRYAWTNVATDLANEKWRYYDRILIDGKRFAPPNENASYWLPLTEGAMLRIDYTRKASRDPEDAGNVWTPPLGSGIALHVEWIDGTQGAFMIHRDDDSEKTVLALKMMSNTASGVVSARRAERLRYFAMAQAKEEAVEFTAKNLMLANAAIAGPEAVVAVELGWIIYDWNDTANDVLEFLDLMTGSDADFEGGGTFVRLRSKVAQYPSPNGTTTLYTFEGAPTVYGRNDSSSAAKAGQAIDFTIGGEVSRAVTRKPDQSAINAVKVMDVVDGYKAAIAETPKTPPVKRETETDVFFNGNDFGVANGGTPPEFNVGSPVKITYIMTYHWNSGRGAPAGDISLVSTEGRVYGPWRATLMNGVYWEVRPNVEIPAGRYRLIDSDQKTWAQNQGSAGCGMTRIKGVIR